MTEELSQGPSPGPSPGLSPGPSQGPGSKITNGEQALRFMLAGRARVTLVSEATGTRFTYRIKQRKGPSPEDPSPHFVQLLTGPDNESSYEFIGTIFNRNMYRHGTRSRIGLDAPGVRAFLYAWDALKHGRIPTKCQVWHEGRCGRCGRALTVPQSISDGLGPECSGRV